MFAFNNVRYKNVLDIPSLIIPRGTIVCLVGKSGGGKSTILRLLNKMISPTQGSITLDGDDLASFDSVHHRRRTLMLEQTPHIFKGTVRDNLHKPFILQGTAPPEEATLIAYLRMVALKQSLDDSASTLSGGEAQRLALARILLLDGDVYLLDEPSSALDEQTEADVIRTMVDFVRNNEKTMVMVTHSRAIAATYGDVIYGVDEGHVRREDNHE